MKKISVFLLVLLILPLLVACLLTEKAIFIKQNGEQVMNQKFFQQAELAFQHTLEC